MQEYDPFGLEASVFVHYLFTSLIPELVLFLLSLKSVVLCFV